MCRYAVGLGLSPAAQLWRTMAARVSAAQLAKDLDLKFFTSCSERLGMVALVPWWRLVDLSGGLVLSRWLVGKFEQWFWLI